MSSNYKRSGKRIFLYENNDGTFSEYWKDNVTDAKCAISVEHANIHNGNFYEVPNIVVSIASGATYCISLTTPTPSYVHYRNEKLTCSGDKLRIDLQEGVTVAGGTTATIINHSRISTNTAGVTVKTGATLSTAGTIIATGYIGGGTSVGGNRAGGDTEDKNEYILKRNTNYALLLTNSSSETNIVFISPMWYEEGKGE